MMSRRQKILLIFTALCVSLGSGTYGYILQRQSGNVFAYDIDTSVPIVNASPADAFVESVGMNVHTAWWDPVLTAQINEAMPDLGIRYLRDTLYPNESPYNGNNPIAAFQHLKQLGVSTEITFDIHLSPADILAYLHLANDTHPGTIYAFEGPNEVDYGCNPDPHVFTGQIWVQCNPTDLWVNPTVSYLQAAQAAVRADSAFSNLTIYSSSITGISWNIHNDVLAGAGLNNYFANDHYYPYLNPWYPNSIENELAGMGQLYGNKPVVVTEIGFPDTPLDSNHPATPTSQAKMIPATYLDFFHAGITRTFMYELQDPGANWPTEKLGIIDANGKKKPAYYALKNLMDTLKDPGVAFSPGHVRYELTGAGASGVSSQLFQKRDGTYYLALWQDSDTKAPTPDPATEASRTKTIGIRFGTALVSAGLMNTTQSTDVTQTFDQPTTLSNLHIDDGPLLIKLTAADEPTPSPDPSPTPTPTPSHGHYSPPPRRSPTPRPHPTLTPTPTPTATETPTPEPATPTPTPTATTRARTPLPSLDIFTAEDKDLLNQKTPSWWERIKNFFRHAWNSVRSSFLSIAHR